MMRWMFGLIMLLALPLAARGTPLADGGVTAPEVAAALKNAGYPADISADRSGDPLIRSSTGKLLFDIYFYQCGTELRCASIAFLAPFRRKNASQAVVAAWNRDRRFGRAYMDAHGIAWIAMDVETSHGMTTEALGANIDRWIGVMNAFDADVGR
jgi:hypothetical protein